MTDEEKQAIETMKHWIDYEKVNKDKINKADELIEIQETVLNLIEKKDKIIDLMAETIENTQYGNITLDLKEICLGQQCNKIKECDVVKLECIKEYFKKESRGQVVCGI